MRVPIVMCTWQRIERLPITLELLTTQSCNDFDLFIWNNNSEYVAPIDALVGSREWPYPIAIHHSSENVGGFGRFFWCKKLVGTSDCSHVIFLDDDQEFSSELVSGFLREAAPRTISSRWSYRFVRNGSYWNRLRAKEGEEAHYCGTCGMIMDISLFKDEKFFSECPMRFRLGMEDLWLSFYAQHVLEWRLVASSVKVRTIADERDTYLKIRGAKVEFLEYLRNLNWKV